MEFKEIERQPLSNMICVRHVIVDSYLTNIELIMSCFLNRFLKLLMEKGDRRNRRLSIA